MLELNKVLIAGRLTKDPEVRFIPSGTEVCDMRVAVGRTYFDKASNERKEEVCFVNVTAWGSTAKFCGDWFKKGKAIFIEGRLKQDTWQDKEGNNREKMSVVADRVSFVESKSSDQGGRAPEEGGETRRSGGGRSPSGPSEDQPPVGASSEARDDLPF